MIKRSLLLSLLLVTGGAYAQNLEMDKDKLDMDRAEEIAKSVCAGCHAVDGNSPSSANPKIAGQHPEYLYKQLRDYSSVDGNEPRRVDSVMNSMVNPLSDDEMQALAHYYAEQELELEKARNPESIELGQSIWRGGITDAGVPACAACHGPTGTGIPAEYPRISGQYAEYTAEQMKAFRSGERANDENEMMRMIAKRMTDEEIEAVSDYAAGLR